MSSPKASRADAPLAAAATVGWLLYGAFLTLLVAIAFALSTAVEQEASGPVKQQVVLPSKAARVNPVLPAVRVTKRLAYGAFLVALVLLALALSAAVIPRLFGYGTLVVNGGSMRETAPNGSLVIARWTSAEDVEVGDAILIRKEDDDQTFPKLHRVVSLEGAGDQILVQTKGDANNEADPDLYILPDRVLTYVFSVPYAGHLVGFAKTPLGWLLLSVFPATVLCVAVLRSIWADDGKPLARPGRA